MAEQAGVSVESVFLRIHDAANFMRGEIERLIRENAALKKENAALKNALEENDKKKSSEASDTEQCKRSI